MLQREHRREGEEGGVVYGWRGHIRGTGCRGEEAALREKEVLFRYGSGGGGVIKGLIDYKEGEGRLEVGLWLQTEEEKKCWDDGKRKRK